MGDALSERDRDHIRMKALSLACPVGDPEYNRRELGRREPSAAGLPFRYPLASGPEGVTLEGRKMAMAGTAAVVNKKRSMPTHLNITGISQDE